MDEYSHEWRLFVLRVKQKERLIAKHQSDLEKLFDSCTHEQTKPGNRFIPATKIVRSQNITFDSCVLCGRKINVKAIHGEYA